MAEYQELKEKAAVKAGGLKAHRDQSRRQLDAAAEAESSARGDVEELQRRQQQLADEE